jgi:hypothetical protein
MNEIKQYFKNDEEEKELCCDTGARFSEGKNRHDLIPASPLNELAKVYTYGTIKYDDDNWWKGLKWKKQVIGSLLRHLWGWIRGEKIDEESNCHHLAMVAWQCFTLMEYERHGIGIDDRIPYTLDLMDEEERKRRIKLWRKLVREGKNKEYNGLLKEHNNET